MQFQGKDMALEEAVIADDPVAVHAAVRSGANVNARGAYGVTPLEFAVGTAKVKAASALIALGADPNLADDERDTAVTMAVRRYQSHPELLPMVLRAGGDPDTLRPNGTPVIMAMVEGANLQGISLMHQHGADIDASSDNLPLVVNAAYGADWDVVWHLIELGADLNHPRVQEGLIETFKIPGATLPDSPLYPAKVKVYEQLRRLGLSPTPPAGYQAGATE